MVDKALFLGASSAKGSMHELQVITNNLANINTTGFRADFEEKNQFAMQGKEKDKTRVYSVSDKTYSSFSHGPILNTGRDLDVAVVGEGFISVQSKSGKEGYTRAGDLQIKNGVLTTQSGQVVMGTSGVIALPGDAETVNISSDGTVSAKIKGNNEPVTLNRIKLATPVLSHLQKGDDGLFYTTDGASVPQNDKVKLTVGSLEGSNVNPVETLTDLIELSRQFELHTNLMKTIQEASTKANQIMELPK